MGEGKGVSGVNSLDVSIRRMLWRVGHAGQNDPEGHMGKRRILRILLERGDMTQREMMGLLQVKSSSMSVILGKMEEKGMISRKPNENDRRTVDVSLTQLGRQTAESELLDEAGNPGTRRWQNGHGRGQGWDDHQGHHGRGLEGEQVHPHDHGFEGEQGHPHGQGGWPHGAHGHHPGDHMRMDGPMGSDSHMRMDGPTASDSHMRMDGPMTSDSHMRMDGPMTSGIKGSDGPIHNEEHMRFRHGHRGQRLDDLWNLDALTEEEKVQLLALLRKIERG
jgi:DNA-binding PadR family transcriptional regulator